MDDDGDVMLRVARVGITSGLWPGQFGATMVLTHGVKQ